MRVTNFLRAEAVLELDNVTIELAGRTVLREVSFRVGDGEKIVLKGPSGSGKSSLLKAILGLVPLASGRILFEGAVVDEGNVTSLRRRVAYVAQEPVLGGDTGREALLLPFTFRSRKGNPPGEAVIRMVLERLGLSEDLLRQPVNSLSGGEKQRIALARALLLGVKLFLLDEITSALDPASQRKIVQALEGEEVSVLAVSHSHLFEGRFDRVLVARDGRVYGDSEGDGSSQPGGIE